MPESLDLKQLCYQCVDIARDAGNKIIVIYNEGFNIEEKDDKSPLTDADIAAHNTIVAALSALTPDIPVLSEESSLPPYELRRRWRTYWLVDPLDGTREFIKRNGEFTVNIALIQDHKSILGVVHAPALNIDYYAWENGGAYKVEQNGEAVSIHARKLEPGTLVVAGSRSHRCPQMQAYMNNLGESELLGMGSSLKLCLVAEGSIDLYPRLGPTSEWDTAAAHCIIEQAGGYLTRTDMTSLEYNTKDSLLNPLFFAFGDNSKDWSSYLDSDEQDQSIDG